MGLSDDLRLAARCLSGLADRLEQGEAPTTLDRDKLDRDKLLQLGWRQGSVMPVELLGHLSRSGRLEVDEAARYMIVNQDCDVVQPSLHAEPFVELIELVSVDQENGAFTWAKNPRRLHIKLGDAWFEASISARTMVDRSCLLRAGPDPHDTLSDEHLETLRTWLGKRYKREAFPDAFNARCRPAEKAIHKALKKNGAEISGIYVIVSPDELDPEATYAIDVRATMKTADFDNAKVRTKAQSAFDAVVAALNKCSGIEVDEDRLIPEAEMTLEELRIWRRWDHDSLSLRDQEGSVLPVE
ncbi:MAG: hypothetical protein H6729_09915 [Deltaproteobacteria bacterium]|nr:hypothetical protein [Deltaproteobacteria bacterium]